MAEGKTSDDATMVGPVLHMRGLEDGCVRLAAILILPEAADVPLLHAGTGAFEGRVLVRRLGRKVIAYDFSLPAAAGQSYLLADRHYPVNAAFDGDLRIAYVACNGQEASDGERDDAERNAMWHRLSREHEDGPFQLLLQGGDQLYADEVVKAHPLAHGWPYTDPPPLGDEKENVAAALRDAYFEHYVWLFSQPDCAALLARVPSLAMWDDHDICDGWGSLPVRRLDSDLGRIVFEIARENFCLFQLGVAPGEMPEHCLDPSGETFTWHVALPGVDIVAPDLRSERRPERVMGAVGWHHFDATMDSLDSERLLLMSSVPALGPRLSVVESLMKITPAMEHYEDDLRDQWQSRTHRDEWRAFLTRLVVVHEKGIATTVLSGEIHLATRGTLATATGPLHQLVASGIVHPAPPVAYARSLGALAHLGASPLPDHPIRLHPLPGRWPVYTAQRNYLVLERHDGQWSAWWELEDSGTTPALAL